MEEPYNFTFFVYDKSRDKWWACSKNALDSVGELKKELGNFSLDDCSVNEGLEKFVEGGGEIRA